MTKKLTKSQDKRLAGVIGGIAEYFDIDTTLARVGFIFIVIFTGIVPGIVFYVIAMLVMPTNAQATKNNNSRNSYETRPEHNNHTSHQTHPTESTSIHDVPHTESTNSETNKQY